MVFVAKKIKKNKKAFAKRHYLIIKIKVEKIVEQIHDLIKNRFFLIFNDFELSSRCRSRELLSKIIEIFFLKYTRFYYIVKLKIFNKYYNRNIKK